MVNHDSADGYSRRVAMRRLGTAGLGAVLMFRGPGAPVLAHDHTLHPVIGRWLAVTPLGPADVVFSPSNEVLMAWPHSEDIERGTFPYTTSAAGLWQPVSAHGVHFTVVEVHTTVEGEVTGTTSLESILVVDEDGRSFRSGGSKEQVTSWDSVGVTTMVMRGTAGEPTMSGIRLWPEADRAQTFRLGDPGHV